MAKVKVLIKGYSSGETGGHSCATVSLVEDNNLKIIVDPGTLPSQNLLIKKLKKEGLKPEDINVVFITHSHMDHYRNIGMFPNAKALDYWGWWEKDVWRKAEENISKNIKLIKTPGHSDDSVTLLVKTKEGTVAICGDVFWKENFPKKDSLANDLEKLKKSRQKVFNIADYIIPGHGKMFRTSNWRK